MGQRKGSDSFKNRSRLRVLTQMGATERNAETQLLDYRMSAEIILQRLGTGG